jgi:hypothetical protein
MLCYRILVVFMSYAVCSCTRLEKKRFISDSSQIRVVQLKSDTARDSTEIVFKRWLRDTLAISHFGDSNGVMKEKYCIQTIQISWDSLVFNIADNYDLIINSGRAVRSNKDVEVVLSLLRDYDELPTKKFAVKFAINYEYVPSPVVDRIYDLSSYLSGLETRVIGDSTVSKYDYIRGRLSDKILSSMNPGSKAHQTDFIWQGSKLIKRKFPIKGN